MDMSESNRERDLVLAPNEFAFILDQTKGNINVYVGPYKTSLANTDKPIIFDEVTKRFNKCTLDESVQVFATAPEGWYMVLKNPAKDSNPPRVGASNNLAELNVGRKVNIPGPVSFALWAGQMVRVVQGHLLRSNQYLLVRVYDEEQARNNWSKAVIKKKIEDADIIEDETPELTMGKLLVIKGVNVSFYMPPTGVEVVRDEFGNYVREAVTLERMEYCILKDEDGNKRYVRGPAVVFPEPTEDFIERDDSRKFKAIELNEISGLYIKIIAPYVDDKGNEYKEGDEIFITGKDQAIYYPRPEHAIIRYGDKERHYSIVIPEGEGRYYLNRNTGIISLKRGPCMFLPDPRAEVLVRRVLDPAKVQLYFPGNTEALEYNQRLQELQKESADDYIEDRFIKQTLQEKSKKMRAIASESNVASPKVVSDEFQRGQKFTPPRTITIDTKYEGAITINVWTGYAVLVISKTGNRKVVVGPQSYLLEYDETLQPIQLSTGTPKSDTNLYKTVYLQSLYNKISDVVICESKDLCTVELTLSYRVNFEGEPEKWFNVDNYVKFLTEHMRSFLRNLLKKHTISEFYNNAIDLVRNAILGGNENGKRPGRLFEENGMRIYDVEVLAVQLGDATIEEMVINTQHDVIKQNLSLEAEIRKENYISTTESIQQRISEVRSVTKQKNYQLEVAELEKQYALTFSKIEAEAQAEKLRLAARLNGKAEEQKINDLILAIQKAQNDAQINYEQAQLNQRIQEINTQVEAIVKKASAISPELIAALQAFSDRALAEKVAQSMAPLSILGGESVADIFSRMVQGTALANVLENRQIKP